MSEGPVSGEVTSAGRTQVADGLPGDMPAEAAGSATESVAGAHEAAEALTPATADALWQAADTASTTGLDLTAVVAAVLFVRLGWMVYAAPHPPTSNPR